MTRQLLEIRAAKPLLPFLGSQWTIAVGSKVVARGRRGAFASCPEKWTLAEGGEMEVRLGAMGPSVLRGSERVAFAEGSRESGGFRLAGELAEPACAIETLWSEERVEIRLDGARFMQVRKAPPDPGKSNAKTIVWRAVREESAAAAEATVPLLLLATPFLKHLA